MLSVNLAFTLTAAVIIGGTLYACNSSSPKEEKKEPVMSQSQMIERGSYLVSAVGCDDCHSPKRMGPRGPEVIPELRFSGYPSSRPVAKPDTNNLKQGYMLLGGDLTSAVGPWGMSFAANISSDATGIGNWTEHNFLNAIRTGKIKGMENGRDMLPPMPWPSFKNFSDEDLKCMFAYLKSTTPVPNVVPPPKQIADLKSN